MSGPRINLHTHLEGCVRPSTAAELARALAVAEPAEGWDAALRMRQAGSLTTFLRHVAAVYPLLGSYDALARVACEAVEDAAADGCDYLELRFGPATHVRAGFPIDQVIASACEGVAEGSRRTGLATGLVVCMLRHSDDDTNMRVAREAVHHGGTVVGLDLAGDERRFPSLAGYSGAFHLASASGLGITAHVAEAGPAVNIRLAAETLGVRRIGHGSRVAAHKDLLEWAAGEGLCFEVCLTSNLLTGAVRDLADHPARRFLLAGCRVVVGDDDPVTTGSRLSHEESLLKEEVGIAGDQLELIRRTSVDVAFCSDSERADLRRRLDS